MKFRSFGEMLERNAAEFPASPALIFDDNGTVETLTYDRLRAEIESKKKSFLASKSACVGLLGITSPDYLISFFAAAEAGLQTVLLDPSLEPQRLQRLIEFADVDTLLTDSVTEPLTAILKTVPADSSLRRSECEGEILFFTSGTTEEAKAVVLTSRSLCASAWNGQQMLPCRQDDNVLSVLPLYHVFGFVCSLLWPMSVGAAVSLGRGMRYFTEDCAYFKPTILSTVPSMLKFMVATKSLNRELRTILVGAGPADKKVLAAARAMGYEVRFGYGLTETSSGVAISCGDDPFAMSVCPDDIITLADDGEILIGGSECMMLGYYKNQAATDEALTDGILHTGDLGHFDAQGCLHVTGRKKDVIALENGTKIYLPEWEERLREALGADEAAIILSEGALTAVCVDKDGRFSRDELQDKLNSFNKSNSLDRQISRIIVTNTPLARTATGKVRRWAI